MTSWGATTFLQLSFSVSIMSPIQWPGADRVQGCGYDVCGRLIGPLSEQMRQGAPNAARLYERHLLNILATSITSCLVFQWTRVMIGLLVQEITLM